ncbi:MAG: hypothetical protein MUF18_11350 [Fimbriiglobus sp.]|jgi:hypothetical protein|nr:hypothetical protein [Fimbriiglobus sp.]
MRTLLSLAMAFGLIGLATAEDKKADAKKGDPTGTWTWETERNGQKMTNKLTLKLDGDKLTGEMPGRQGNATKIEDGTFKDGEVTFTITRMAMNNKIVTKYKGKVDGDTIKLTAETERNGETQKREIEAKRSKEEPKKDK